MKNNPFFQEGWTGTGDECAETEIRRVGAKLRHFRGVAVSVMDDALRLWEDIWVSLQDNGSCGKIPGNEEAVPEQGPGMNRSLVLNKLRLLGMRIEYARRLCEGSIDTESQKGENKHG